MMKTVQRTAPMFWVGVLYGVVVSLLAVVGFLLINPLAAHGQSNAIAEKFGVTIVWSDDGCASVGGIDPAACFNPATPSTIYVTPGLDEATTNHLVLHEIGHVMQNRLGLPNDECAADRFAQSLGSQLGYYCQPN